MKYMAIGLAIGLVTLTASANVTVFDQGFESDTDGIEDYPGPVTRVASGAGTLGVTSGAGAYHAEAALGGAYGNGFYTRNGGYSPVWPGYIKQSIKVYIDPAAGQVDDGWWWDAGLSKDDGGWAAGGGFGVRKTATDTWSLGAEDSYGGFHYVGNTRPAHDNTTPLQISTAGWYTLATEWVESTSDPDLIDQVNTVRDAAGSLLWTDTIPDFICKTAGKTSLAYKDCVAGGMSYSWLGSQASEDDSGWDPHPYEEGTVLYAPANTMTLVAVDDAYAEILPEPATLGLLALGGVGALARRRRRQA